jgi:hypothetical protein
LLKFSNISEINSSWIKTGVDGEQNTDPAARIVTGLHIFTKSEYLYAETGWETLSERRYRRKLQLFFNIKSGVAPEYL